MATKELSGGGLSLLSCSRSGFGGVFESTRARHGQLSVQSTRRSMPRIPRAPLGRQSDTQVTHAVAIFLRETMIANSSRPSGYDRRSSRNESLCWLLREETRHT